ncbi:MAG: Minf_1886 family protein [Pirellulaceae bacterium]
MPRTISDEVHPLVKLLCEDHRYKLDAYTFVRDGLHCAQQLLYPPTGERELEVQLSRHITGQDLCHALRHLAHDRYGYLALPVLESWGLRCTGDFGEIVYNLIKIGEMSKSPHDSREHFDDVYDFELALLHDFAISRPAKELVK